MKKIAVYGHRGYRGLLPEHSLEGYKFALELGVDYLDGDIVLTKDEKIILAHDLYVNADLIQKLRFADYRRLVGIDKQINPFLGGMFTLKIGFEDVPHMLNYDITQKPELLGHPNGLYIFARPCHSNFVEVSLDNLPKGIEALYITVPENLEKYDDLGKYKDKAKQIFLKGNSVDNEVIYSIIK